MSRLFTDVLRDINNGELVEDLTAEMANIVEEVENQGKPGSISLKLNILPNGVRSCTVGYEWKSNPPKAQNPKTLFFTDNSGGLTRSDPRQHDMQFEEVPTTQFKEAENE